jgi:hypothetical protein
MVLLSKEGDGCWKYLLLHGSVLLELQVVRMRRRLLDVEPL